MATEEDEKHPELATSRNRPAAPPKHTLDEVWPVHRAGGWPEGLSLRREDIYTDRIELVGG